MPGPFDLMMTASAALAAHKRLTSVLPRTAHGKLSAEGIFFCMRCETSDPSKFASGRAVYCRHCTHVGRKLRAAMR